MIIRNHPYRTILTLIVLTLMVACTGHRPSESDQQPEPSFQERVTQCSKIADRSERDHCLYGH